jgi:hypothetical protein
MRKRVPGFIRNVHFEKLRLSGLPGAYQIQLSGADSEHNVQDVLFEDVSILDQLLTSEAPSVRIGEYVERVRFVEKQP